MLLEKELQPRFIYGYTNGFCDGLAGKKNAHEMPETQWNSEEKLDLKHKQKDEALLSDVEINLEGYKLEYKMIGHNWGHMHGRVQRDLMKSEIPGEVFERRMELLSEALRIQFLEVNRKGPVCYRKALDPRTENRVHVDFVSRFVIDLGKAKCDKIRKLLEEKKTQQAIENAIDYFDKLKDLENYLSAISFEAKLKKLRLDSQIITKDEYQKEKLLIDMRLRELIDS